MTALRCGVLSPAEGAAVRCWSLEEAEASLRVCALNIGLLGLVVLLLSCGDTQLLSDFLFGMPAVGTGNWDGVLPAQPCGNITLDDVLSEPEESKARARASLRPS